MNDHFVSINQLHVEQKVLEYVMLLHRQNTDGILNFHTMKKKQKNSFEDNNEYVPDY